MIFDKISVRKKTVYLAAYLLVALITVSGLGFKGISELNGYVESLGSKDIVAVHNATLTDMMHDGLRATAYMAIFAAQNHRDDILKESQSSFAEMSANIQTYMGKLEGLTKGTLTAEKVTVATGNLQAYINGAGAIVEKAVSGEADAAVLLLPEFNQHFEALEDSLGALGEELVGNAYDHAKAGMAPGKNDRWIAIAAGLFFSLSAMGFCFYLIRGIRTPIDEMMSIVNGVASSSEELMGMSNQMSASSEETAGQANVVSAAAEQVNKNIQTVATAVEEMSASVKEISKNTTAAANVAGEAVLAAEATNQTIAKLGDSGVEIGNVIKVITSIAEQTNLLALNATIEAARAGEAGKGFAVVANEVKELAKQTAKATEEISHKIEVIQANTEEAVSSITHISEVIAKINDFQTTVASAVEEQSATTNEIGRNVIEAAKGSAEIAQSITYVAQAAQGTTSGASNTHMAAQELAGMSARLRHAVERF